MSLRTKDCEAERVRCSIEARVGVIRGGGGGGCAWVWDGEGGDGNVGWKDDQSVLCSEHSWMKTVRTSVVRLIVAGMKRQSNVL